MSALLEIGLTNAVLATLLAVVVAGLTAVCRQPAVAYWFWMLVLVKLITPPMVHVPVDWPPAARPIEPHDENIVLPRNVLTRGATGISQPQSDARLAVEERFVIANQDGEGLSSSGLDLRGRQAVSSENALKVEPLRTNQATIVMGIWVGGSALWFLLAAFRTVRFAGLVRHAKEAPSHLVAEARRIADLFHIKRQPRVCVVAARVPPMLWAVGPRAVIILPADLVEQLTAEQQSTLLAHELAHFGRGDHWIRWLEFLIVGLYWWHPVAWWARRQLAEAEEACCDAWVVDRFPERARSYAQAILETIVFLDGSRAACPAGASPMGQVGRVKRRLEMILRGSSKQRVSWPVRLALLLLAVLVLPVFAQSEPSSAQPATSDAAATDKPLSNEETAEQPAKAEEAIPELDDLFGARPEDVPSVDLAPAAQSAASLAEDSSSGRQLKELEKKVEMLVKELEALRGSKQAEDKAAPSLPPTSIDAAVEHQMESHPKAQSLRQKLHEIELLLAKEPVATKRPDAPSVGRLLEQRQQVTDELEALQANLRRRMNPYSSTPQPRQPAGFNEIRLTDDPYVHSIPAYQVPTEKLSVKQRLERDLKGVESTINEVGVLIQQQSLQFKKLQLELEDLQKYAQDLSTRADELRRALEELHKAEEGRFPAEKDGDPNTVLPRPEFRSK